MGHMNRFSSMVWVAIWFCASVASVLGQELDRSAGPSEAMAVTGLIGVLAGVGWYAVYPRPLAQRLKFVACFWMLGLVISCVVAVVRLVGIHSWDSAGPTDSRYKAFAMVSVLAGLVLAELQGSERAKSARRDAETEVAPASAHTRIDA